MKFQKLIYLFIPLLTRCAQVPQSDLANRVNGPSLVLSEKEALRRDFFRVGQWPEEKWWEMFHDEQLNALIARGLKDNYSLKTAHERVAYAYQLAKGKRSKFFPEISGNYTEQWQYLSKYGFDRDFFPVPKSTQGQIPHTLNLIDLTLNFSYEFDFWGKNRDLFYAALGQARAEVAEEKQAQLITAISIAQTYFSLQAKGEQKQILQERLREKKELFSLTDSRFTNGLIEVFGVLTSDIEIHNLYQAILFLEEGIEMDKHMLKYLIGLGPDDTVLEKMPTAHFNTPFPLPENISSDLLARRPDLMAQIWRVEAAAKDIGAARADFYPDVNLLAFAGLEALSFGNLFRDSKTGGLSPAIHLPIFTGGRLRANLRSKVAAFNQAMYAYNDLMLRAVKEVADAIVTVQTVNDAYTEQRIAFKDTAMQYALQFSRYMKGRDNFLSVLDREEEVLQQRFLLTGLQLDHLNSVLSLIKGLGGGYVSRKEPQQLVEAP
jgi:NodT family efflux transporter outer membrane factor (OMF) lipoprotein